MTTDQEFDEKNRRRHFLIDKQHAGFTEEEMMRPFEGNPGWREECERREHANLTDEEQLILGCLGGGILTQDALSERLGLASPKLAAGLMMLELKRLVSKRLDGSYEGVVD